MIKFINAYTGTEMYVTDERAEEYKRAGHRPVPDSAKETEVKEPVKKKTTKKK